MIVNNENANSVNDEIKEILREHPGHLGKFHKLREKGKTPNEMQKLHGNQAYSYIAYLKIILGEEGTTKSPRLLDQSAGAIGGMLKKYEFTPTTRMVLESRRENCLTLANQESAKEEQERIDDQTLNQIGESSVYAYTFPHYFENPYVEQDEDINIMKARTMIKVGMTTKETHKRILEQKTGMPENPLYLLGWKVKSETKAKNLEKLFHNHLNAIGHVRKKGTGGGKEWFLTNIDTLESVGVLLGLELIHDFRIIDSEN